MYIIERMLNRFLNSLLVWVCAVLLGTHFERFFFSLTPRKKQLAQQYGSLKPCNPLNKRTQERARRATHTLISNFSADVPLRRDARCLVRCCVGAGSVWRRQEDKGAAATALHPHATQDHQGGGHHAARVRRARPGYRSRLVRGGLAVHIRVSTRSHAKCSSTGTTAKKNMPFFSEPPVLYATHVPSGPAKTIAMCSPRCPVPQIVRALCTPFALFGEVAGDVARRRYVFRDGNVECEAHGDMQMNDDNDATPLNSRKHSHHPAARVSKADGGDYPDPAFRAPTRFGVRSGKRERNATLHKAASARREAYIAVKLWRIRPGIESRLLLSQWLQSSTLLRASLLQPNYAAYSKVTSEQGQVLTEDKLYEREQVDSHSESSSWGCATHTRRFVLSLFSVAPVLRLHHATLISSGMTARQSADVLIPHFSLYSTHSDNYDIGLRTTTNYDYKPPVRPSVSISSSSPGP
ncbi:hypothetical protein EDB85DRAFT_2274646 [Lactarius pseudohatsudake]|nr:hypothetical protein EDB85DRAFT_2274646 [Lactarius pseudohatsudake]